MNVVSCHLFSELNWKWAYLLLGKFQCEFVSKLFLLVRPLLAIPLIPDCMGVIRTGISARKSIFFFFLSLARLVCVFLNGKVGKTVLFWVCVGTVPLMVHPCTLTGFDFWFLIFWLLSFRFWETMIGLYLCPRDLSYGRLCGQAMCFTTIFLFDCQLVFFFSSTDPRNKGRSGIAASFVVWQTQSRTGKFQPTELWTKKNIK